MKFLFGVGFAWLVAPDTGSRMNRETQKPHCNGDLDDGDGDNDDEDDDDDDDDYDANNKDHHENCCNLHRELCIFLYFI